MATTTYDIQALTSETGVPRRTIYFYVQQGLLPPPQGAGLAAYYTEDHLLRLKLISILRQQGLRLDKIREKFKGMSIEEMRRAVQEAGQPAPLSAQPGRPAMPGYFLDWGGQRYTHYALPHGMTLIVPESTPAAERQRIDLLLQAARQIFSGPNTKHTHLDSGQPGQAPENPEEQDSHSL